MIVFLSVMLVLVVITDVLSPAHHLALRTCTIPPPGRLDIPDIVGSR
ncbi:hypothetical protein [Methanopyrus kandleri]